MTGLDEPNSVISKHNHTVAEPLSGLFCTDHRVRQQRKCCDGLQILFVADIYIYVWFGGISRVCVCLHKFIILLPCITLWGEHITDPITNSGWCDKFKLSAKRTRWLAGWRARRCPCTSWRTSTAPSCLGTNTWSPSNQPHFFLMTWKGWWS